jgi:hypothetical protein
MKNGAKLILVSHSFIGEINFFPEDLIGCD